MCLGVGGHGFVCVGIDEEAPVAQRRVGAHVVVAVGGLVVVLEDRQRGVAVVAEVTAGCLPGGDRQRVARVAVRARLRVVAAGLEDLTDGVGAGLEREAGVAAGVAQLRAGRLGAGVHGLVGVGIDEEAPVAPLRVALPILVAVGGLVVVLEDRQRGVAVVAEVTAGCLPGGDR